MGIHVIVTGGRHYKDRTRLYSILDFIHKNAGIELLNHGGAKGADTLADEWAQFRGVSTCVHHADWKGRGPGAGPYRNQNMVDHGADFAIAFPGGKGTKDCVFRIRRANIALFEVPYDVAPRS